MSRRPRSWTVAALVGVTALVPVGLAVAAEDPPAAARPVALRAPIAGHPTVAGQMHEVIRDALLRRHLALHRRVARLEDRRPRPAVLATAHRLPAAHLERANRRLSARAQELDVPVSPVLARIAQCESGDDPRAIGGGGRYRGAFQMAMSTWASVGGKGDPIDAPLAEQYRRAAILLARSGPGQWPVCA